jgi:hypothetical protein
MSQAAQPALSRRTFYSLLLVVVAGSVGGRLLAITRMNDPGDGRPWPAARPPATPLFGSNDRSRWATVRALVDQGTYVIGQRDPSRAEERPPYGDVGIIFEPGWESVDKVLHPERQLFYSSKPPLLPTVVAGEYWLLKNLFGWSLADERGLWIVVRIVLLTINGLPFLMYLWLIACLVERFGQTDFGRLYVFLAACFGTLVTPFLVTFNNHTLAACCALFALYPILSLERGTSPSPVRLAVSGLFAAWTACIDLPATAFAATWLAGLLYVWPRQTLAWFVPAAALPMAAFFLTNYLALGRLTPAYGEFGGPWYEYEGSHWKPDPNKPKRGIDWAKLKESRAEYAFHFLIGHHGLFSLFPIFALSLVSMGIGLARSARSPPDAAPRDAEIEAATVRAPATSEPFPRWLLAWTAFLTVVVVGFYLYKTDNYGGWTCGPRWLTWLTPFWLLALLPFADRLAASRTGRIVAGVCLAVSVLSASYPTWNPWRHPWIYVLMDSAGLIPY